MCSVFRLNKTVQDVTQEIINIMSLYEFPQIPFIVKGYLEELIRKFEALESDVFFFQDMIEMWYIDRKQERWILKDSGFSSRLLFKLKNLRVWNFPLIQLHLSRKKDLSQAYYKRLLISYIKKLHLIKCSLVKWLNFLFIMEGKLFGRLEIHDSLKMIFQESVDNS